MIDTLDFIKLALGLGAFVFIVLVGARDKRITGLLLTFPVMNGIAMLTSPDPFRVAQAISLLVVFNTLFFWAAVATVRWIPPKSVKLNPLPLLVSRVLVRTVVWCVAAYVLTDYRDRFPPGWILFAVQSVVASVIAYRMWSPARLTQSNSSARSFMSGWQNWTVRIILFLIVYAALLSTAHNAGDQKWTGMASALPIAGFFGLAYLSTVNTAEQLRPIRDTVLFGPLLVIPFNWIFAGIVTATPAGPSDAFHIAALLAAWATALALVFWLVPAIERYMAKRAAWT